MGLGHFLPSRQPEANNGQISMSFEDVRRRTYKGRSAVHSPMFPLVKGHAQANALCASMMRDHRGAIEAVSNPEIQRMLSDLGFGDRVDSGVSGATTVACRSGFMVKVRRRQQSEKGLPLLMFTTPDQAIRIEREDRVIANTLLDLMGYEDDFHSLFEYLQRHDPVALANSWNFWNDLGIIDGDSWGIEHIKEITEDLTDLSDVYGWPRIIEVMYTVQLDPDAYNRVAPYAQNDADDCSN